MVHTWEESHDTPGIIIFRGWQKWVSLWGPDSSSSLCKLVLSYLFAVQFEVLFSSLPIKNSKKSVSEKFFPFSIWDHFLYFFAGSFLYSFSLPLTKKHNSISLSNKKNLNKRNILTVILHYNDIFCTHFIPNILFYFIWKN